MGYDILKDLLDSLVKLFVFFMEQFIICVVLIVLLVNAVSIVVTEPSSSYLIYFLTYRLDKLKHVNPEVHQIYLYMIEPYTSRLQMASLTEYTRE